MKHVCVLTHQPVCFLYTKAIQWFTMTSKQIAYDDVEVEKVGPKT